MPSGCSPRAWTQSRRGSSLVEHHGAGLLTGGVGSGRATAARTFTAALNPNLYGDPTRLGSGRLWICSARALELNLEPAHYRGDLVPRSPMPS
jgi:hypothetical protein